MERHINILLPNPSFESLEWENPFLINRVGYYKQPKDHHMERTNIKEAVLILCLDGYGYVSYKGTEYQIQKGGLLFLEPHTPHRYGTWDDRSWTILWIHFSGSGVTGLMKLFQKYNIEHISHIPNYDFIAEELRRIISLLRDNYTPMDIHKACCTLQTLLVDFVESHSHGANDHHYIQKAVQFMKNHINDNIDLNAVSQHLGISSFHTIRIFKRFLMTTPMQYYNTMRVNEACKLMQSSDLTVTEISQKLNYNSQFHFSQVFKKKMGLSPTFYKQLMYRKF